MTEYQCPAVKEAGLGLAMDRDQNLLAGIGEGDQFAQACLGFPEGCDHVTTRVLSLSDPIGMWPQAEGFIPVNRVLSWLTGHSKPQTLLKNSANFSRKRTSRFVEIEPRTPATRDLG